MDHDIQKSFDQQPLMATLGARLARVAMGDVEIRLPVRTEHTQHTGALHAGVLAAIADSACGFASLTRMPADRTVVSVEFKLNLLSPAVGSEMRAIGRIVRAGRTLTVCSGEVWNGPPETGQLVAIMQATMMAVPHRG